MGGVEGRIFFSNTSLLRWVCTVADSSTFLWSIAYQRHFASVSLFSFFFFSSLTKKDGLCGKFSVWPSRSIVCKSKKKKHKKKKKKNTQSPLQNPSSDKVIVETTKKQNKRKSLSAIFAFYENSSIRKSMGYGWVAGRLGLSLLVAS